MKTSNKGVKFQANHEGTVLTAYLDAATPPVPTVGRGFTNKSPTVTRMIGKIVPGKTKITLAQCDRIHAEILAIEVDPVVTRRMPDAKQHEHDAASSGCYNLGAERFMGWTWADLWRSGHKGQAWDYLSSHYNTAGGKPLPGLVRRRKEEALLGRTGHYTGIDDAKISEAAPRKASPKNEEPDSVVTEAQELLTVNGFNPGAIDGWMGEKTKAALIAYQEAHPHLENDGVLGPATLSQLRRDAVAAKEVVGAMIVKNVPSAAMAGGAAFWTGLPWHFIVPSVLLIGVLLVLWAKRDLIQRRLNTAMGKVITV